jgi:hypothetical protein
MKKLILALAACLGLSGCVESVAYAQPVQVGTVEVCNAYGCYLVPQTNYYYSGGVFYYYHPSYGYVRGYGLYHGGYYHGYRGGYGYHGGGFRSHFGGHGHR